MSSGGNGKKKDEWLKDWFVYGGSFWFGAGAIFLIIAVLAGVLLPALNKAKKIAKNSEVIVYTSQDQVYAEPIFQEFTKQSGIKVRAVYDSEAVKTVGLVNRLIAEKNHPQCDVFWNNEELRTRQLERKGVLRETNSWEAFGFRTRQLVVNTNLLKMADAPSSLLALTNRNLRGKVALAYPLFGTTGAYFLVLRQKWGETNWKNWCRALANNKPFVVDGNSVVVNLVGKGEAWIGLTDSDDIMAGQREGLPLEGILLSEDGFQIRNTVGVVRNAPHPEAAQKLVDFLRTGNVLKQLNVAGALDNSVPNETANTQIDWDELLLAQESALNSLKGIFLR